MRLEYIFELRKGDKLFYYSEDGLTESYDFATAFYNAFQIAYINPCDVQRFVEWMHSACFYQIFVDRFYRGDYSKDDAYIDLRWGQIPTPKSFAGGDLAGIRMKFPYLEELGVNALYLTPIFKSVSNHKYGIQDYYTGDECFSACDYMPKWNTSNREVQDFLIDIAVHWIEEYHIDGWRLDVSDKVSHVFW